jgi:cyclic pyranopterin monophosphate synthase
MEITTHFQPWEGNASFKMADIGAKETTLRAAVAQGRIGLSPESFLALTQAKNPKGNVLAIAEVSGILAAKKTSELIPLCHLLPLDQLSFRFDLDESTHTVTVICQATTHAKTGVEMEALSGVNGALLAIYDLSKAVDPVIRISDIRLKVKEGGKRGRWVHPDEIAEAPSEIKEKSPSLLHVRASVITISDRVSEGRAADTSGPAIIEFLRAAGAEVLPPLLVSDDKELIASAFRAAVRDHRANLVISSGGTGLGPRDVTPEALALVADRMVSGFGEWLRQSGATHTDHTWLSRSGAGTLDGSLLITLPGSRKAVEEGLRAIENLLPHALKILQGGQHG